MSPPPVLPQLIQRFRENLSDYRSGKYNETQVRREFLDSFFEALGWDVNNTQGYAEAYKDVVHEDAVKVGGMTKAPDYGFRIGGTRKFFVEAKKPSVNVKDDLSPAFQLRRYAWSAKLPLSILTDFEEFAVYDCRVKPVKTDKAATARVMYCTFEEYAERWEEIAAVFSREAVLKGSFDRYAEATTGKRGTQEVDAVFLAEIERWRELLARNIALRNPGLSVRDLNYAVQLTIDRLVFLRIGEDRGFEPYERLRQIAAGKEVYARLLEVFREADARYNSGLFHFRAEKGRENVDTLTPRLMIDDKVFKEILSNLYYPDSPYDFNVMPADILGQVYEQFLGKVIRLTKAGRAEVEDKPEVKKAGGVYYTPTYIVDYIVRHTVGKLVEGKTPEEVAGLKICDPACGSGSFLLGAYQFLLDWHLEWYATHTPEKWARGKQPRIVEAQERRSFAPVETPDLSAGTPFLKSWKLTTAEKRRILLNNLYGVDIDPQAVEVTKLSLLLKVLEGENEGSLRQLALFHERVLPDLNANIKCGNSLIGPDFYDGQLTMFDLEESYRINAFDWEAEFPQVFSLRNGVRPADRPLQQTSLTNAVPTGGFDAVIGNPPYIRIQALKEWAPKEVEFYKQAYTAASKGNYDIYVVFVEKGLSLLNEKGLLGFILPHKFFNAQYGEPLRGLIAEGKHLSKVVHFGDQQVFAGATTYTCLMFLSKKGKEKVEVAQVNDLETWQFSKESIEGEITADSLGSSEWNLFVGQSAKLLNKLNGLPNKLGDISHLFVGLQTDGDDIFILEEIKVEGDRVLCKSKATNKEHWFENAHLKYLLKGSVNIRRYFLGGLDKRLIFPYETIDEKSLLIYPKSYQEKYPLTWAYLQENKNKLVSRNKGQMGNDWHGYVYKKNHTRFDKPKLVVPSIATGSCFAPDLAGEYYFVGSGGGGGGGYGILLKDENLSEFYLLGVLNSNLISYYLKAISTPFRGGYIALNRQYIEQLPIRPINFTDPAEVALHDRMVALVQAMLDLHQRLAAAHTPTEKTMIERQIKATDGQIDRLVYELYGLTEEEVGIVEG